MARQAVKPPQEIADAHALVAQRYAGYFVGHPYRNPQMQKVDPATDIDWRRPWTEPNIVADGCVFCVKLTDKDAERRVAGIQYAIDIEATRSKSAHYLGWLASGSPDVVDPDGGGSRSHEAHLANRRRFCELFQDTPTERRPDGWRLRPLPLVSLPLRLKRKMCIEWNHVYLPWMKDEELEYDFDKRVFYHEVADSRADESDPFVEVMEVEDQRYVYVGLMGPV